MLGGDRCVAHTGRRHHGLTITDQAVDAIVRAVSAGCYLNVALAAAGVPRRTFYDWWNRGQPAGTDERDAPARLMRERVERARAEGEMRNVALIANAARENWQAAAWILERSAPERWARASQREGLVPELPAPPAADDPFAELDELAARRRDRT
jgi:hypothetical protein